jgi:Subtilase family
MQIVVPLLAIIFYILPLGFTTAQNGGGPPENSPYRGPLPPTGETVQLPASEVTTESLSDDAQGCDSKDVAIGQAGSGSNCGQVSADITENTESAATLASPVRLTSPTTLIPSSIIPTKVPSDQWSLIQYCQSTDLCPNIKIIQRTILDRPYAVLPSPEFIRALRQDLIPTTDINALAATIPAQYPGVEVFNVIDTPGYKAIAIRGVNINNPIFSDPRFSSTEQQTYSGHIAQVGQNQGQPLIWNQTLPNGVKRTIPISMNPTTVVIPATVVTPVTSNAQPIGGASQISSTISTSGNTSGYSGGGNSVANQGSSTTSERIVSESGLNDFNNVVIAVLDTGISLIHPDLNVYRNVSFVDGTNSGDDDQGHGSHVAGIAAAKDNSIGVRGVAPDARLWAIKVCDKFGECKVSNQMKGIEYATKHANEIDVLNISIENPNSPALNSVINEAVKAGITVVVAAGNSGSDASTVSPANNPNVLTVSAIGDSDGRCGGLGPAMEQSDGKVTDDTFAYFSNFGPEVKLAAPGVDIFSTYNGTDYALDSGTSMATPHAAGAAALYKAEFPNASPTQVMAELVTLGSTPSTQCDGGPRGYFTGDADGINEPLLFAALLPSQG